MRRIVLSVGDLAKGQLSSRFLLLRRDMLCSGQNLYSSLSYVWVVMEMKQKLNVRDSERLIAGQLRNAWNRQRVRGV